MTIERKLLDLGLSEIKLMDDGAGTFEGYASVFMGVDSNGDMILPGAYQNTLANRQRPIQLRWNHHGPVIGKWLEAAEDDKGLRVKGQIVLGHSVGADAYALMKAGAVTGLSIGYRIPSGGSEKDGRLRKLKRIDLVEISIVENPADMGAQIGDVKAAIDELGSLKDAEAFARDVCGLSWTAAKAFVSQVKSLALRDGEAADQEAARILALFNSFNPKK